MQEQAEEEERLKRQDAIDGSVYVNFFTTVTAILNRLGILRDGPLFFERGGGVGQFLCFTLKTIHAQVRKNVTLHKIVQCN